MFSYVNDISDLAHDIIRNYSKRFDIAVDCTLGNGHDSDFLSRYFKKVYAFDIQEEAVNRYLSRKKDNVRVFNVSHTNIDEVVDRAVDVVMFNLGYLPGSNKEITTLWESTEVAIDKSLKLLNEGGLITIAIYHGHIEGKIEKNGILEKMRNLNPKVYGVMTHCFHNRSEFAPLLVIIEKKHH